MRFQVSIVSGKVGDDLLTRLPKDGSVVHLGPLPDGSGRLDVLHVSARRLTRLGRNRKGERIRELSGGVRIEAWETGAPNVGAPRQFVRRLRPGWTREQFRRAVHRCYFEARELAHLNLYRENLCAKFKPHERDSRLIDAAEEYGAETGLTTAYAEMSREDCLAWAAWLERYLEEQENAEAVRMEIEKETT